MSAGKPVGDRDLIPRWRDPRHPAGRSELTSVRHAARRPDRSWIQDREADFELHQTLGFALDLVGTAVVLGATPSARAAARLILDAPGLSGVARTAATVVLADDGEGPSETSKEAESPEARAEIRDLRAKLTCDPRNALAWAEMARNYTILGERGKADRSMRVALGLMPDHRFVLRAAARLAVHHSEFDRAHAIVARSACTPGDPWLVATELATAGPAEARPRFVRHGRTMLESGQFPGASISELASALGTLDLRAGSGRRGRLLIQRSLESPNDNTIAQGQWLSKQLPTLEIDDVLLGESAEARALRHGGAMESEKALQAAWDWYTDQPFASGPGELGSYHASVAGQHEEGVAIASAALRANPGEFLLSNNLAYCLLKLDRIEEAAETLDSIATDALDPDQRVTYMATLGLLHFRLGDVEHGRDLYLRAVGRSRDHSHRVLAKINLAVEEYRAGYFDEAAKLIDDVVGSVSSKGDPELTAWLRRLPRRD